MDVQAFHAAKLWSLKRVKMADDGKWSIVKLPGNLKDGEFSDEQCGLFTKQCTQSVRASGREKVLLIVEIVLDRFKLERVFSDSRPHSSGTLKFDFSKLADMSK